MSLKRLGLYVVLLLAAASGYLASEYYQQRREQQEETAKKVFQIQESEIRSLQLQTDRGIIALERGDGAAQGWRLVQPLTAPVDEVTIKAVLQTLADLKSRRRLTGVEPARWREFGLDKPILTVDFTVGEQKHRLRFGAKVPGEGQYYAQADEGEAILLLAAADKESLDRNLTAFRDKTIFRLTPEQVTGISLNRGAETLVVQKQETAWVALGPPPVKLRPDKVEGWLRQLQFSRIVEFVAEKPTDPGKYGLVSPTLRLTLTAGNQQETLLVGSLQQDRYYAQKPGQPTVFQIDKTLVANLPQNAAAWEEKRLWPGPESQVHRLSWGPPERRASATRTQESWQLSLPDQEVAPGAALRVNLILWKIKELEFQQLTAPVPETAPGFGVQLHDETGKLRLSLEELRTGDKQVLLRWQQGDQVQGAWVAQASWEALKQELAGLGAPTISEATKNRSL